ncbi:MAG: LysR family transcriptional regulator [Planctomycetota bacterium]
MLLRQTVKLDQLNFHHLYYFWVVAEEGSVTAASKRLGLAQPSVSAQVRKLEDGVGGELFDRSGRGRVLSQLGREVHAYADRIFAEGQELIDFLNGKETVKPARLVVGVPDSMPKLLAYRLLQPVYGVEQQFELLCHASKFDDLLSDLAVNRFDVVLSNAPVGPHVRIRAFNHKLGESTLTVFGAAELAAAAREDFPNSLAKLPMLLPAAGTELRRSLDLWMQQADIRPRCVGEFYDSALLKEFGAAGVGLFAIPGVVSEEVCRQYRVEIAGELHGVRESVYAITHQKRIAHPGVSLIVESAREMFATSEPA